ncbi:MAG: carbohydrate-binding family 9-like protein [Flavobacteriaceae bacterium]
MMANKPILFILAFSICIIGVSQPKSITPKQYIAYNTTEAIKIDGKADEKSWKKATWTDLFIDIEGEVKPKYNTKVKMLWDKDNYYILAKIEEPHIWASLKQRDTVIFYNNDFEVFLDPDNDTHNYYEIEINAINTVWDLFITKPYRESGNAVLNDWTLTNMQSAITINGTLNNPTDTDTEWLLEIAMPWAAFRTSYGQNNVPTDAFWRVNFSRVNWQHDIVNGKYQRKKDTNGKFLPEYNWVWSPQGVINMHEPEKWGYVYFSSKEIGSADTFSIPEDEHIKWCLFELYRAQKKYYQSHGKWAPSIKNLSNETYNVNGKTIIPKLENHATGYNISAKSPFSNKTLTIKEDGKILSH